ncbi:hypothetical protein FRC07_005020 [Ceratobasidium sp. 392]|nr:hypothetical protein FRC07_005020 [Ceratobasidium sp. 392]
MGKTKKGRRRSKDVVSSQSSRHTPTPVTASLQAAGSSMQAASSRAPEIPSHSPTQPTDQPSTVVSPDPEPCDTPNPDIALIGLGPPTEERRARGVTRGGLKTLVGVLKDSVNSFGPLKEAFGGLYECVEIFEQEAKAREDHTNLEGQLAFILKDLSGYLGSSTRITMTPIIESIAASIKQEVGFIQQKTHRSRVKRIVEATKDAEEVLECYRRIQTHLTMLTVHVSRIYHSVRSDANLAQLNANMDMWKKIDEQTMKWRLKELANAPTAMYRSVESDNLRRGGCTPNTRVDVMDQLRHWANDATSEKVYWLNGMAGTGKTTIAYTLCDQLQRDHQLGASFFCSRQLPECRNVNRIVPSISYQLALFSLPFRYALSEVLEQNDDIQDQPLEDQFEHLIAVPLQGVAHTFTANVVIVIDALDECDTMNGADRVLRALLSSASGLAVKFFVTSRPEPKIVDQMRSPAGKGSRSELRLHDLDRAVVEQDITTYLKDKLPRDKVSEADIERLALRSGVLFIYASTVVRYIEYDNFSRSTRRLRLVLEAPHQQKTPGGPD